MSISRYSRDNIISNGKSFGTARGVNAIRQAIRRGEIALKQQILSQTERLDVIAGQQYGDSSLWWVIAAASNIGWGLQVPAGTQLNIPIEIEQIASLVS